MMRDPLWDEIDRAFLKHGVHPDDQTPILNLNRIAGKCVLTWLCPENCTIHKEPIPFKDLQTLILFDKPDRPPAWDIEPIVVLQIDDKRYVVDGRRRVWMWRNDGVDRPRTAIVITPRQWRKWPQQWNTEKPTRSGWYWFRPTPNASPYPVKIFDANEVTYIWPVNDRATRQENVTIRLADCDGEFAGPMEPPA